MPAEPPDQRSDAVLYCASLAIVDFLKEHHDLRKALFRSAYDPKPDNRNKLGHKRNGTILVRFYFGDHVVKYIYNPNRTGNEISIRDIRLLSDFC